MWIEWGASGQRDGERRWMGWTDTNLSLMYNPIIATPTRCYAFFPRVPTITRSGQYGWRGLGGRWCRDGPGEGGRRTRLRKRRMGTEKSGRAAADEGMRGIERPEEEREKEEERTRDHIRGIFSEDVRAYPADLTAKLKDNMKGRDSRMCRGRLWCAEPARMKRRRRRRDEDRRDSRRWRRLGGAAYSKHPQQHTWAYTASIRDALDDWCGVKGG
ncbi:hypothetical protein C8R45DRAFT_926049 [Mycena sanguinolenta]|nr:hypothetical protein C8R45DRAFT_926049 [Mycena sanguinolenta]